MKKLILASGSSYRNALLQRLLLPFESIAPDIDELRFQDEPAAALCQRLAHSKALLIAQQHPDAVIIGSDQVAVLGDQILGKPGTAANAREQLALCSGHAVQFLTSLCVLHPNTEPQQVIEPFEVVFRQLSDAEIARYVELEQPLDCAGSFKWESLGISLFERLRGNDPTALEGLPLIQLTRMLRNVGLDPLTERPD
jgi:septum formation protein